MSQTLHWFPFILLTVAVIATIGAGLAVTLGPTCRLGQPFVPRWVGYVMAACFLLGSAAGVVQLIIG